MYHLLAVDDEKAVLEMLKDALDWQSLGIDSLYIAYNISMAKNIIEEHKIHFLLCDIEMPGGNGLELLEWVRNENYPIITLFLTGFANFEYARRAISLGSLDYLLKPITFKALKAAIEKAVIRLEMSRGVYGEPGMFLEVSREFLAQQDQDKFWEDILCIQHGASRDFVSHCARNHNIENVVDEKFLLICGSPKDVFCQESGQLPPKEQCRELISDIFGGLCVWNMVIQERLICICHSGISPGILSEKSKILMESFAFHFHINLSVYIGEDTRIERLYRQFTMLKFIDKENISVSKIYFLNHWKKQSCDYVRPDFNTWGQILISGNEERLYGAVREYMELCRQNKGFSKDVREVFFHDFLQMLYSVLKQQGIWANSLFESREARQVFDCAMRSYEDLELNLWMLCHQAAALICANGADKDCIAQVKGYVADHIFTEFSREDIAAYVHVSPEHLSRLFKKAEGMTLVDYIQMKKIEAAKQLLKSTRLSVGEIALRIGYKNFAYFSGIFKKYTGQTPMNYRRQALLQKE